VPRFDVILKPGEPLPEEFAPILDKRSSPALRQKLLKHGGLIRLSVASPYVDRREAKRVPIVVDETFIRDLEANARDTEVTRNGLQPLTIKQLLEVCSRLKLPVRSNASSREIREAVVQQLQSGRFWQRISGSSDPERPGD